MTPVCHGDRCWKGYACLCCQTAKWLSGLFQTTDNSQDASTQRNALPFRRWRGGTGRNKVKYSKNPSLHQKAEFHLSITDLGQVHNCFGLKYFSTLYWAYLTYWNLWNVLKKCKPVFVSSWLAQLHQARLIEHRTELESKTITYLTQVCWKNLQKAENDCLAKSIQLPHTIGDHNCEHIMGE